MKTNVSKSFFVILLVLLLGLILLICYFVSQPKLTQFEFNQDQNYPYLGRDIKAKITHDQIDVTLPAYLRTSTLKPKLSFKGKQVLINNKKYHPQETKINLQQDNKLTITTSHRKKNYTLNVNYSDKLKPVMPHLFINTKNNKEVTSRDEYIKGQLSVDGKKAYPSQNNIVIKIRGRGNSTWGQPKKPYKLKLAKAFPLLELAPAKKWILLANFQDSPLISDLLAFKVARLLNIQFTHSIIPVEITLNNNYLGVYMLTEQKEVGKNRIAIGDNDLLYEFTTSKDESSSPLEKEHYQYKSKYYGLSVLPRAPKLHKMAQKGINKKQIKEQRQAFYDEFNKLEKLIAAKDFPNNNYGELLNKRSFAKLYIVHFLTKNEEINHPKSVYFTKEKNGKFSFGPAWDFDWAYGGGVTTEYFQHADARQLFFNDKKGGVFFQRLLADPEVKQLIAEEWHNFRRYKYSQLIQYMDSYFNILSKTWAYNRDYRRWAFLQNQIKETPRLDLLEYSKKMHCWLEKRSKVLDEIAQELKKSAQAEKH